MHPDDIHQQRCDDLRRIGQRGMELAAEMLAKLLQQPLSVQVDEAWMADQVPSEAQPRGTGIGIYVSVSGELKGGVLLFFPETGAEWLSCQLLRKISVEDLLVEPASSTLKEVGNILVSTFLASLEAQLGLQTLPSPPELLRAPIKQLLAEKQKAEAGPGLVVRTRLSGEQKTTDQLQGLIYLLPDPESLQFLMARLENH